MYMILSNIINVVYDVIILFVKQKTAYEMRISDWSSACALPISNTMRLDNMVLYQTPSLGGFKAGVGYSFSADDTVSDTTQTGFATGDNNRVLTVGMQ